MLIRILFLCFVFMLLVKAGCLNASTNPDQEMKLKIYHYKAPCMGESVQLCFRIQKENGEIEFFHDLIEGLDYQWGYNYTIIVEEKVIKNPMSDASSIKYKLKKLIKKEKVSPDETFELPLSLEEQSLIKTENGSCSYFGEIKIQAGSYSCEDLAKFQSAIFRHMEDGSGLALVKMK